MALTTITTELTPEAPLVSHPPYHVSTRTTTKLSAAVVTVETALAIIKLELGVVAIDAGKMTTALRIVIFTEKALEEEEVVSGR